MIRPDEDNKVLCLFSQLCLEEEGLSWLSTLVSWEVEGNLLVSEVGI